MRPPLLPLELVREEEGEGCFLDESMVGSLGVWEDEPVGPFLVEPGEVGEEQVFVVVDEWVAMMATREKHRTRMRAVSSTIKKPSG